MTVSVPDLAFYDQALGRYRVDDGPYLIQTGSSADDVQLQRTVIVHGRLTPVPATVTAKPTMPGDAARGIQSRVMFPVGSVVLPGLTVAMTDQSLHHLGLPPRARMKVRLRSDRPAVVSVGRDGTLRTLHDGVATITAAVTFHHVTASGQFVVYALSQLDRLAVSTGRTSVSIPGFAPDAFSYDVTVSARAGPPRITAGSSDPRARVAIAQAGRVPGAATIVVRGPDGLASVYKVYFARPARGDEFSGGRIGHQWTWLRHHSDGAHVVGGSLVLTAEHGAGGGGRNLLVQPALGNWTITSKVTLNGALHAEGQQAGIIAYQDDDDFLKLDWEFSSGVARIALTTEDSLSGAPVAQVLSAVPTGGRLGRTAWLRLVKHGARYAAYFSGNGVHFVRLYEAGAALVSVRVGLFAWGGTDTSNSLRAAFAYFHVRQSGLVLGGGTPVPATGRRRRRAPDVVSAAAERSRVGRLATRGSTSRSSSSPGGVETRTTRAVGSP
jgi:regulation of enolase protein 1 (concanavalin A-like superfamily)